MAYCGHCQKERKADSAARCTVCKRPIWELHASACSDNPDELKQHHRSLRKIALAAVK